MLDQCCSRMMPELLRLLRFSRTPCSRLLHPVIPCANATGSPPVAPAAVRASAVPEQQHNTQHRAHTAAIMTIAWLDTTVACRLTKVFPQATRAGCAWLRRNTALLLRTGKRLIGTATSHAALFMALFPLTDTAAASQLQCRQPANVCSTGVTSLLASSGCCPVRSDSSINW